MHTRQRQDALQRPRWICAKLVLHAVAPLSLQRSVKRPNRWRHRSRVRNNAEQNFLSAAVAGCRQRVSTSATSM